MAGLVVMSLMVALVLVSGRLQVVEARMRRPLAGVGRCDDEAGCGHMHYGNDCPRCGCASLVL